MRIANRSAALFLGCLAAAFSSPAFAAPPFTTGEAAVVVVGEPNMTTNSGGAAANLFSGVDGVWSDGTKLVVADSGNNRILIFNTIPTDNNASADVVIGQNDMASHSANQGGGSAAAYGMSFPTAVTSDGTKLVVNDEGNSRVLVYNTIPTTNNALADVVIGQNDFVSRSGNQGSSAQAYTLSGNYDVYAFGGSLYIADASNNRVLVYNTIPTNNDAPANIVIGQNDFTHSTANQGGGVSATTLSHPQGIWASGSKLFVMDQSNRRALIYSPIPTSNNAAAYLALGQPDLVNGASHSISSATFAGNPYDVFSDGTSLLVPDYSANRVLEWSSIPTSNGIGADAVLGQVNFASNSGGISSTTLNQPFRMIVSGGRTVLADYGNKRVLLYPSPPSPPTGLTATGVSTYSVTAAWTASAQATSYIFQVSTASNFSGTLSSASVAASPATLTGLSIFTTYYLEVAAVNSTGTSGFTSAVSTMTNSLPPFAPTISASSTGTVSARWTAVGGSGGYELDASTAANFSGTIFSSTTAGGAATGLTVAGLNGGTTYYLRAGALWSGTTNYAASLSTITPALAPGAPAVSAASTSTISAGWTPVGSNGYELDASTAMNFSGTIFSSMTANGAATSLTLSGLSGDTTYYLRAGALWNGTTNYAASFSTMTQVPPAPVSPAVSAASTSTITVSWTAVGSTGYELDASTATNFSGTIFSSKTTNGVATALTVSGLSGGTTYYLRAGALWSGTTSYATALSTMTQALPAPGAPAVSAASTGTITVSWTPVDSTGYEFDASTAMNFSGTLFTSSTANGAATALTVAGLSGHTTYYLRAGALWSGTTSYAAVISTLTPSLAPVNPAVSTESVNTIGVSWTAVGSNGYELQRDHLPFDHDQRRRDVFDRDGLGRPHHVLSPRRRLVERDDGLLFDRGVDHDRGLLHRPFRPSRRRFLHRLQPGQFPEPARSKLMLAVRGGVIRRFFRSGLLFFVSGGYFPILERPNRMPELRAGEHLSHGLALVRGAAPRPVGQRRFLQQHLRDLDGGRLPGLRAGRLDRRELQRYGLLLDDGQWRRDPADGVGFERRHLLLPPRGRFVERGDELRRDARLELGARQSGGDRRVDGHRYRELDAGRVQRLRARCLDRVELHREAVHVDNDQPCGDELDCDGLERLHHVLPPRGRFVERDDDLRRRRLHAHPELGAGQSGRRRRIRERHRRELDGGRLQRL